MNRYLSVVVFALACVSGELGASEKPNFLIIMADDCTHNDLSLYGGQNAITPNIDGFAATALTFNRAYLSEAMCQPCRAELYTGQYPMRNGCAWNHSASRPETQSLPQYLSPLGYRVGLAGKVHVKPEQAFPFENISGFDKSCVREPTLDHDLKPVKEFMRGKNDSPFCLVVALVEPHVPWVMGDPSQYPPKKIKLPPNIADTPQTRQDYGKYLAEITYMDSQVGELLTALEQSGNADNTVVIFTSEQGSQFPGCKWTNWDTGLHTAMIVRWPGQTSPGTRTDALVQYADVAPTLLSIAGGKTADYQFDGTSFRNVLTGETDRHRQFVYGVHNNIPEGPAYPIRTISDGNYRYIRNLTPDEIYIEKHLMGFRGNGKLNNAYWGTWIWDSANSPRTYNLVKRYTNRPSEALYQTSEDKYELNNIAASQQHSAIKNRLSTELDNWLASQGDPGIPQDTMEAIQAARRGEHLYGPASTQK